MARFSLRGVWSGASEAGDSAESVGAFVDRLADAGFNAIFLGLKEGDGRICWPSERFARIVREEYRDFDLPAVFLKHCQRRGVEAHAWFIDFMEGADGVAFRTHPEWAMRNRHGKTTNEEVLRGEQFPFLWMCPAQRPGYADQWLIPLYAEFAARYSFVSLHHDYVRYPGDLAPDQYCFCDSCRRQLPEWASYVPHPFPDEPFTHEKYDREYLESHWEQSPRVLPAAWDRWSSAFQSDFLLEGSFFQGGRSDLDYFFYLYRIEAIERFVKECAEAVRASSPVSKLSGALFKNPIHSGRFIGQDWRRFAPWMDHCIPMNYRDHYPGTMGNYLGLLKRSIEQQLDWAGAYAQLSIGVAIWPLFREAPDGPYPQDRLERTIEAIAETQAQGLVIFCEGDLDRYGQWPVVQRAFRD